MDAFYHSNTIPVIAQLQNQIDSIDRFLSWVCPDYTRYKGFMEFQQQPFTPLFQTPPQLDITNTNASTFQAAGFHLGKDPLTAFNNNSTNNSFTVPPRRAKKKRGPVPPTAMKDMSNNSELPLKRRGRKRKCPLENGNDNKENMNPANNVGMMPQPPGNPCGMSVCLPMPGTGSTMNCFKPLQQSNAPKSCNEFTKLDLLAAVSSLFKGNQRQFSSGSRSFQPLTSSNVTNAQFQQSLQQRAHWAPPHCCQNHEMYPELQQHHHGVLQQNLQQNQESINQSLRIESSLSPSDSSMSGSGSPEVTRIEEEFNIETSIPDHEVIV